MREREREREGQTETDRQRERERMAWMCYNGLLIVQIASGVETANGVAVLQ